MTTSSPLAEARCRRCNSACPPPDLDECLGCNSKGLCPACMLAHNCQIRARQNHLRHYDQQRSILQ